MQSKVGYSVNRDVRAAVEEATNGIVDPVGIIIMTDHERLQDISTLIKKKYPRSQSIGVSGTNYYNTQSSDHNLIITAFTGEAVVHAGVIRNLSACPAVDVVNIRESMSIVNGNRDNTVFIEYCTNDEERLTSTINMALGDSGIHVVGGTELGYAATATAAVTVNGQLYADACAYMMVKNTNGRIKVYSENIYGPMEGHPTHIVTKADLQKKAVYEIDHKPVAEVYSREMGVPVDKVIDNVLEHPFGRIVGDQVFIASQKDPLSNGALTFYKRLNINDSVSILKLNDFDSINKATREAILRDIPNPALVLSVNCIYRYLLFTGNGYYHTLLSNMATLGPSVGNIGGGEQFDNQHVNQTMVVAVFE